MHAIELIHGDCLAVLPTLPDGIVSAIVTDPPYGIEHQTNYGASWSGRQIANDANTFFRDAVIEWAESKQLPWAVFGTWKIPAPLKTRVTLVWDKGPAFGMGDLSLPWKSSWEEIYIGGKGWVGKRDEGVLHGYMVVSWESKGRKHPHQKPVSLIKRLLSKLPSGFVIFDPFMGSGTTGVACAETGRRFIGCEIDKAYFDLAASRIRAAAAKGSLFLPPVKDIDIRTA